MINEDFMDYFDDEIDYPRNLMVNILPLNTLWSYVASSFLDGVINYVDIKKAYLLDRYNKMDGPFRNDEVVKVSVRDGAANGTWVTKECTTKRQIFDAVTTEGASYHSKMDSCFRDDVLLLSKAQSDDPACKIYCFFWFDRDSSDSCIGRFETDDPEEIIISKFTDYVKERQLFLGERYLGLETSEPTEIPLHYFKGWLSH